MRKQPRQARSRAMVDRIVAAARAVLVGQGYDAVTTNRVGGVAGVRPGSVYQYFPDKSAIIDVVVDRWSEAVSERVAAALVDRVDRLGRRDPAVLAEVMDALVAALEEDAPLLRVALEELPTSRHAPRRRALEDRVVGVVAAYLAGATGRPGGPAVTVAWVTVLSLEQLASRWVLDRPAHTDRDALVAEMTRLAAAYLGAAAGPA